MSIRTLQWLLIFGCIAATTSVITGIAGWSYDNVAGPQVSLYTSASERVWTITIALVCGLGAWGIYRRVRIVWSLGWAVIIVTTIWFMIEATISLLPKSGGWMGIIGVGIGGMLVLSYWGIWWQRQRDYFFVEGKIRTRVTYVAPLLWFGIALFLIALIFISAAVLAPAFHK